MTVTHDDFAAACIDAFSFLVTRFGFGAADVERIGRESFVQFHRNDATVSVAWEPGSQPIVELFYPPTNGERTESWAVRNGVDRCRRIPRLRLVAVDEADPRSMKACLVTQATALEQAEHVWLSAAT